MFDLILLIKKSHLSCVKINKELYNEKCRQKVLILPVACLDCSPLTDKRGYRIKSVIMEWVNNYSVCVYYIFRGVKLISYNT